MSDQALWNLAWEPDMSSFGDLTQDKTERSDMFRLGSDMSGKTLWNPDKEPDKADWDLAAEELGLGRTCPVPEPDMPS
jgi:hypothetical protein